MEKQGRPGTAQVFPETCSQCQRFLSICSIVGSVQRRAYLGILLSEALC
jgi:hypothetical protein